ncbi:hypothetical protein ACOSQ4_017500 [Xanthoceras sorbifolium]
MEIDESMEISPWIHRIDGDLSMDSSNPWRNPWSFPVRNFIILRGGRGMLDGDRRSSKNISKNQNLLRSSSVLRSTRFFVDRRTLGSSTFDRSGFFVN